MSRPISIVTRAAFLLICIMPLAHPAPALAQRGERPGRADQPPPTTAPPAAAPQDQAAGARGRDGDQDDKKKIAQYGPDTITHHAISVNGALINYTATAGTVLLKEEDGKEKANIFFTAYTKNDGNDAGAANGTGTAGGAGGMGGRPITFCFNGGPGSSSVWLHLGAWGPKRVEMGDAGALLPPPWKLVDNEGTLLDLTDLVFIDPVTTGYSRAVPGENPSQYHGVDQDIEAVGEFIRLYTTRFQRWSSPKFIAGESYGTTRAAGLSGHLQDRHGMFLNGVILVSAILNFGTARFDRGNDLPYVLFLPTYAATAWYHQQLDPELQADLRRTLDEVEAFALGEYTLALARGSDLPADERRQIAERLARYTGLTADYIEQGNLRLSLGRFAKELLRSERRTVGRLDSRFKGIDADAGGVSTEYDPSYAAIQGPYTATFNHYVRDELGFETDLPYEILTGRVNPWSYGRVQNQYLNVAETLRSAMTENQALRVFFAGGYYDFATPYFAAEYTASHLGLEPELQDHVTFKHYEAGHMMYIHMPSLTQLKADLAAFYAEALAR